MEHITGIFSNFMDYLNNPHGGPFYGTLQLLLNAATAGQKNSEHARLSLRYASNK